MRTIGMVISFEFDYFNPNNRDIYGRVTGGVENLIIAAENPETSKIEIFKAKRIHYEFPLQNLYVGGYIEVEWPSKSISFVSIHERGITQKNSEDLQKIREYLKDLINPCLHSTSGNGRK